MKFSVPICGCIALASIASANISTNSIDTFDLDNEGWRVGNAGIAPTFNAGQSFNNQPGFLRHFSDNSGSNGRWIMWSEQSDWTGDYTAAGVNQISLWADGRTGNDIQMWLGFDGPGGWFFTPGQTIFTADDWKRFEFDIAASDLIYANNSGGSQIAADTLSNVTRFEIFAGSGSVSYANRGDLLRADRSNNVIWLDNIAAVPEPSSAILLLGMAVLGLARRRLS